MATSQPTPPAPAGYSVSAAARRVGVAAATLRSWEQRYGLGPALRSPGGHRRYSATDLVTLHRVRQLTASGVPVGAAAASVLSAPDLRATHHAPRRAGRDPIADLTGAVEAMDAPAAHRLAERLVARHGPETAWVEVFVPVLQTLGERWGCTGAGVEREHLAAAAIQAALTGYMRRRQVTADHLALLALAGPGEQHVLPLHALTAALAERGRAGYVLSAMPPDAVRTAADDLQPSVVLIWAHARRTADLPLASSLLDRAVVLVGGPGWPRRRLPAAVTFVADLPAALGAVMAWSG